MSSNASIFNMIRSFDSADESLPLEQLSVIANKLEEMEKEIDRLGELLLEIGNIAHDASTGPAVPDVLWEIRSKAYQQ
jgi:hypothetical protein